MIPDSTNDIDVLENQDFDGAHETDYQLDVRSLAPFLGFVSAGGFIVGQVIDFQILVDILEYVLVLIPRRYSC